MTRTPPKIFAEIITTKSESLIKSFPALKNFSVAVIVKKNYFLGVKNL